MARVEDSFFHTLTQRLSKGSGRGDPRSIMQLKLGVKNVGKFPLSEEEDNTHKIFTGFSQFTSSRRF